MLRICFVCLGNICRSPMAEFVMKDLVRREGLDGELFIFSAGTAGYHDGEDMHFKTKSKLKEKGIAASGFKSQKLTAQICAKSDFIVVMDESNYQNTRALCQRANVSAGKILKMCDFAPELGYSKVPDPWYSGDFDETYHILSKTCESLLEKLKKDLEKDKRERLFRAF